MKKLIVGIVLAVVLLSLVWLWQQNQHKTVSGPIAHSLYIWQRAWTPAVNHAIEPSQQQVNGYTVLGAEVTWHGHKPQAVRVNPDLGKLKQLAVPVGIALRIGMFPGTFAGDASAVEAVAQIAQTLINDAEQAGLTLAELQLDYDCSESKLQDYLGLVRSIKKEIAPIPLTITVLPSWLRHRAFYDLAHAVDAFVLQVHSLQAPRTPDEFISLCDTEQARKWIMQAAQVGVPFQVALPTYGYIVAFDQKGKLVGISAESPKRDWPADAVLRAVRSDAVSLAQLVRELEQSRPAMLTGIIWFRMPVKTDQLNWRWRTLCAIIDGTVPQTGYQVRDSSLQPELVELTLENSGDLDFVPALTVRVTWNEGSLVAADAVHGFRIHSRNAKEIIFKYNNKHTLTVLSPGDAWSIGWLRFDQKKEVQIHVTSD